MDQENQQKFYFDPAGVPAQRKRGRPRKADVPFLTQQQKKVNSASGSNQVLLGHSVSGILDGKFEGGYLITVQVGTGGPSFKGVVFDPNLASPISEENDIAPNMPMLSRNHMIPPKETGEPSEAVVASGKKPLHQNVIAHQPIPRRETVAIPTQPLQQNARALKRNEPVIIPRPLQSVQKPVSAVNPLQGNEPGATVPTLTQPVQQAIRALPPLHRIEHVTFRAPPPRLPQIPRARQPPQRNEPLVVNTASQPVHPQRKEPVNVTVAPSLFVKKSALKSDSRAMDTHAIAKLAPRKVTFSASASTENPRAEAQSELAAKEKGISVSIKSARQLRAPVGCELEAEDAWTGQPATNTANILNSNSTVGEVPVTTTQAPKHLALIDCNTEPEDSHSETGP